MSARDEVGKTLAWCNVDTVEALIAEIDENRAELAALRAKFDEAKGVFALTAAALNEEIFYRKGFEAEVTRLNNALAAAHHPSSRPRR